jgi:ketosteroid isomerase-like protein
MRSRNWRPLILPAWSIPGAAQGTDTPGATQRSNPHLEIVRAAFDAWAAGGSSFFDDVLSPDVRWTIRGSGLVAQTYLGPENFAREAAAPLTGRLAGPIKPRVCHMLADGDLLTRSSTARRSPTTASRTTTTSFGSSG